MPEYMEIDMTEMTAIYRHELLILDMLANANWERPLYMAITVGSDNYPEVLQDFFVLEGLAYRITPFNWTQIAELSSQTGIYDYPVDTEKFYNNVMDRFRWGGIKENKDYYADETIHRMVSTHRTQIATLAQYMHNDMILAESDNDSTKVLDLTRKVIMLLDKYSTELPGDIVRHDPLRDGTLEIAKTYKNLYLRQKEAAGTELFLGEDTLEMLKEKCQKTASVVVKSEYEYLNWYNSLRPRERNRIIEEHRTKQLLEGVQAMLVDEEESEDSLREKFDNYVGHSLDKVYDILLSSQKALR